MDQITYTYFIGWTNLNLFYYGSRYGKGCHPTDFWQKYFTSSKRVAQIRLEHGDPDLIQIRKTFKTPEEAMLWEKRVLRRMKVKGRKDFLNETMGNMPTMRGKKHSAETKAKMSAWQKGIPKPEEATRKMIATLTGKKMSDQARANQSKGHLGLEFSKSHCANIAKTKIGRKFYHKDGIVVCKHEHPGEGWVLGKPTKKSRA